MPVLLMARGDQASRNLLRRAIEFRYSLGPPVIETLHFEMKGRTRTKLGPVTTWVGLESSAYFKIPVSVRWNTTARPVGLALSSSVEAFDGAVLYRQHNRDPLVTITSGAEIDALKTRLWAWSAMFLTPLAEHFVQLNSTGENSFEAVNLEMGTKVELSLTPDGALEQVAAECLHPISGKPQIYTIGIGEDNALFGSLVLPRKLVVAWDDDPELEIVPVNADINQPVADTVFRLEDD